MRSAILTGLDVLHSRRFDLLRGKRVGLLTHPAAHDSTFTTAADLIASAPGVELVRLFGPEHGFTGEAQDLEGVTGNGRDPLTGVQVVSLYGDTVASLKPTAEQFDGLDVLVIDLQDVGSRYYTFQATMLYCLEAAADVGLPVVVLDRPNPLGGETIEGPTVRPGFESFVGIHPVPIRHGMTVGELARLYRAERAPGVDLTVIPCENLKRSDRWAGHWFPPSPNMPTVNTANLYPGMCLVEGTNLSEGRGTTRPFEYVGLPGIRPREVADRLNGHDLPGVRFLPVTFRPTFQKHAGKSCGGVFVLVTDPAAVRPVAVGLAVVMTFREQLGERFRWRTERYEFVDDKPAIDLLFGSDRERLAIEAGNNYCDIITPWKAEEAAFRERRKPYLIYPD
jgi:uncharacterized protein YbbC (DUF1343 family)